jgi:hypothetical protein
LQDGRRKRSASKRFRREREALRLWSSEQTKIENGTWHEHTPKTVTLATALKQYREYSTIQNRSHRSYVEPALSMWEAQLNPNALLAKITPADVEDVTLLRARKVAHSTVDKDLAVLKAFFNWCMARNLTASNPVRRVKFFNEDNSRLRYLTEEEYARLLHAAKKVKGSTNPITVRLCFSVAYERIARCCHRLRGDAMAFRIERLESTEGPTVLVVSGRFQGQNVHTLKDLLETQKGLVAIDLTDVLLVDREAVTLLSLSERKGIELRNCPAYVREWVTRERARIESRRSDLDAAAGADVETE